jgi:hypothetical protein
MILHFDTSFRKAAAGALLALMVWLAALPAAKAIARQDSECGAQCCRARKAKKSCCCRKQPSGSQSKFSISARSCPPGCGQASALPAVPFAPTTLAPLAAFVLAPAARYAFPAFNPAQSTLCFVLFQRPPPAASGPTY